MEIVDTNIEDLKKLCAMYNVEKMHAFGSVLNSNFNNDSGIDLLVKFKLIELSKYFHNYMDFKFWNADDTDSLRRNAGGDVFIN
jgi:predicted nucleotidyltransferase